MLFRSRHPVAFPYGEIFRLVDFSMAQRRGQRPDALFPVGAVLGIGVDLRRSGIFKAGRFCEAADGRDLEVAAGLLPRRVAPFGQAVVDVAKIAARLQPEIGSALGGERSVQCETYR